MALLPCTLEHSGYLPPITVHLLASGETSSNLDSMFAHVVESQEQERR